MNDIAPPYRPCVDHDAPTSDPVFPFPDTSATDVPDPASNEYPTTNPGGTGGAAGVTTLDDARERTQVPGRVDRRNPIAVVRRGKEVRVEIARVAGCDTCENDVQPTP